VTLPCNLLSSQKKFTELLQKTANGFNRFFGGGRFFHLQGIFDTLIVDEA
jgi:hypothetical protein